MRSRRLGAVAVVVAFAGAAALPGAGTARAADLHYQCENVTPLVGLPNQMVRGEPCTGPLATGWGSVTSTTTGVGYWCSSIRGQLMLGETWVFGQGCTLI